VINKWVQVYTDKKTAKFEKLVGQTYLSNPNHPSLITTPLKMSVKFYLPVPNSVTKKMRSLLQSTPHIKKPDTDNLLKSINDGLNLVAFADDALIYSLEASKVYDENPRTEVTLFYEDRIYDLTIGNRRLYLSESQIISINNEKYTFLGIKEIGDKIPNIPCIYINNNKVKIHKRRNSC